MSLGSIGMSFFLTMCGQEQDSIRVDTAVPSTAQERDNGSSELGLVGRMQPIAADDAQLLEAIKAALVLKNREEGSHQTLVKILKAQKQVVSGVKYSALLLLAEGGRERRVQVELWNRSWLQQNPLKILSWRLQPGSVEP